jgi:hypothetical protein
MKFMGGILAIAALLVTSAAYADDVKIVRYSTFIEQLRHALAAQGVDLGAYSKDIEIISSLASKCPSSMPKADFRPKNFIADLMGVRQNADSYYDTPAGHACEIQPAEPGGNIFLPKPLVSGSEPRKLYVAATAQRKASSPGNDKAAFQIAVFIEPKDRSSLDKQCIQGGAYNSIVNLCMQLIINAIIIPEQLAAAEAAAANQRQRDAELQASRKREEALAIEAAGSGSQPILPPSNTERTPSSEPDSVNILIASFRSVIIQDDTNRLENYDKDQAAVDKNDYAGILGAFMGTGCQKNVSTFDQACIARNRARDHQALKDSHEKILARLIKNKGLDFQNEYRTRYIWNVVRSDNYEGNLDIYLEVRPKGLPDVTKIRVLLTQAGNEWRISRYTQEPACHILNSPEFPINPSCRLGR